MRYKNDKFEVQGTRPLLSTYFVTYEPEPHLTVLMYGVLVLGQRGVRYGSTVHTQKGGARGPGRQLPRPRQNYLTSA